jgi:hypothetical protein
MPLYSIWGLIPIISFHVKDFAKDKSLASFLESICRILAIVIKEQPDVFAKKALDFKVCKKIGYVVMGNFPMSNLNLEIHCYVRRDSISSRYIGKKPNLPLLHPC